MNQAPTLVSNTVSHRSKAGFVGTRHEVCPLAACKNLFHQTVVEVKLRAGFNPAPTLPTLNANIVGTGQALSVFCQHKPVFGADAPLRVPTSDCYTHFKMHIKTENHRRRWFWCSE
jgi:hypothetical protein